MRRTLPARIHLPSGRLVQLSDSAAREAAAEAGPVRRGRCARDIAVLSGPRVLADAKGVPLSPLGLGLPDAHVLRALLAWSGVVLEESGAYACENCDAPFDLAPSALLEIGPFIDGELCDPELDRPFDFTMSHRIPAVRVGRAVCRRIRFAERTVEEAMPLLRASGAATLRVTPGLVAAMGITELGPERRATVLADALASASDEAWGAVLDLYHAARYPRRLVAVHRCERCGARNDLDVPLERELPRAPVEDSDGGPGARGPDRRSHAFPDLDDFEARVRAAAERVYRERGVRNIDLVVDAGVPACDDGGEPLLGCYTPGTLGDELGIAHPPEIRIFFRTFRAQLREDPGLDLDAEILETMDHEVTHHLHHLAGSDPLDDAEHDEIERERVRLVGRAEAGRRARRGAAQDLAGFLRATWPVWLVVAMATALAWCEAGPLH